MLREQSSNWLRGLRLNAYLVTLLSMILLAAFILAPQLQQWFALRQQIADLEAEVQAARENVELMQRERARWDDPAYIRAQARDRLYYVMPGEVSYLVMDADGIDLSDTKGTVGAMLERKTKQAQLSQNIELTENNWIDSILESVIRAGIEEPAVGPGDESGADTSQDSSGKPADGLVDD